MQHEDVEALQGLFPTEDCNLQLCGLLGHWVVGRWRVAYTGDVGVYLQMMVDMGKQARLRYAGMRRCGHQAEV